MMEHAARQDEVVSRKGRRVVGETRLDEEDAIGKAGFGDGLAAIRQHRRRSIEAVNVPGRESAGEAD